MPDYQSPQSLNFYVYTLDNPVNLVDPSGHDPLTKFDEYYLDGPQKWTEDEKQVVNSQVDLSANKYASVVNNYRKMSNLIYLSGFCGVRYYETLVTPEQAFKSIHGGPILFLRSSETPGNIGLTLSKDTIIIYNYKDSNLKIYGDYILKRPKLVTHELGHAFEDGTDNEFLQAWNSNLDRSGTDDHKDSMGTYFGFAGGYENWQFGWDNTPKEVFADMYLGWVYNQWDIHDINNPNGPGYTRWNFMHSIMTRLLVKYTDVIP
jgi:hypothetical protein